MIARHLLSLALIVAAFGGSPAAAAERPGYVDAALRRFNADVPRGWAYTLTTTRGDTVSVERYDPSKPKGGEWVLLSSQGRAPTADELQRYNRYKASNPPPTSRASFAKGDLDLSTLALLSETAERAEFVCRFRENTGEPLLNHVVLTLTVNKSSEMIERTVLRLMSPFSPALGVRMRELELAIEFQVLESGDLALPRSAHSRFRGRMFFLVPIEEELRIEYSDFARVMPAR